MADNNSSNSSGDNDDQYNKMGMYSFIFAMVFVLGFFFYIVVFQKVDLKENIQSVPTGNNGVPLAVVDVSKIAEPWLPNEDMVARGKKVFAQNCTTCHGNEGKGDGAAGQALNPKPRNLVEGKWKKGGGYIGIYTVLAEGLPGSAMVSFANVLKPVDRWALVQFINSITENKVTEDPAKVAEFAKTAK